MDGSAVLVMVYFTTANKLFFMAVPPRAPSPYTLQSVPGGRDPDPRTFPADRLALPREPASTAGPAGGSSEFKSPYPGVTAVQTILAPVLLGGVYGPPFQPIPVYSAPFDPPAILVDANHTTVNVPEALVLAWSA